MDELTELRKQIDEIDTQIISLLEKRIDIVKKVGFFKRHNNLPFLDPVRKQEMMDDRIKWATKLPKEFIKKLFELIHDMALEVEKS